MEETGSLLPGLIFFTSWLEQMKIRLTMLQNSLQNNQISNILLLQGNQDCVGGEVNLRWERGRDMLTAMDHPQQASYPLHHL